MKENPKTKAFPMAVTIRSVEDIMTMVPEDRIGAFLKDLRKGFREYHKAQKRLKKEHEKALKKDPNAVLQKYYLREMVWLDDDNEKILLYTPKN